MIVQFNIYFPIEQGDNLYIIGSSATLGNFHIERAIKLTSPKEDNCSWQLSLKIDHLKDRIIQYKYFVKRKNGEIVFEAGGGRRLAFNSATVGITTIDQWQENDSSSLFLTDPFAHVFYGASYSPYTQTHKNTFEVIIRGVVVNVPNNHRIAIYKNPHKSEVLKVEETIKMAPIKGLKWIASLNCENRAGEDFEYKFALINNETGEIQLEDRQENRRFTIPPLEKHQSYIVESSQIKFNFSLPHFAGCSIPLSSLRSHNSAGIGEIRDINLLVDWAKECGMKIIKFLPICDTTKHFNHKDSSPYSYISSIAINPIYLSLSDLPKPKNSEEYESEWRSINRRATIDWGDVYSFKFKYFQEIYNEHKINIHSQPGYYTFLKENRDWIYSYGLFCSLRDYFGTCDYSKWGRFSKYDQELVDKLSHEDIDNTIKDDYGENIETIHSNQHFYIYLQFALFNQMNEAIKYAHSKGIALCGELPMNITKLSVDGWKFPNLFQFEESQNCNWEEMKKDNYQWWILRMRAINNIYDIVSLSKFQLPENKDYVDNISKILPIMKSATNMLLCGKYFSKEKNSLNSSLEKLNILPLNLPNDDLSIEQNYFSIATSSISSTPTLRMWLAQKNQTLSFTSQDTGDTYFDATSDECKDVLQKVLSSDSIFAIIPFSDWLSIDNRWRTRFIENERIDNPNVSDWVWKYRIHKNLEQLIASKELNNKISELILKTRKLPNNSRE